MAFAAIAGLALAAGALIGAIGIGGVLLVPALSLLGVPVHAAIAAAMAAYAFSGAIAAWVFARHGSIDWASAGWLGVGAAPAAYLGAALASRTDGAILTALIAATVIIAAIRTLRRRRVGAPAQRHRLAPLWLGLIGAAVGLGSALTGTGGPVLLMPLLLWLDLPLLTAVGLSQAIQVPIAVPATAATLAYGSLDLALAGTLGGGVIVGSWLGARAAHRLPIAFLTRLVGVVLLAVGALLLGRLAAG